MKYLLVGDLHLGKGNSIGKNQLGQFNSRLQDQINLLDWILDTCIQNDIDTIVITGDVFQESKPHPTIIGIFFKWLKKCENKKKKIHIINGNHEILRTGSLTASALDLVNDVEFETHIYKDFEAQEFEDAVFYFLPYRDKRMYEAKNSTDALAKFQNEFNSIKIKTDKPQIVIGHFALEGCLAVGDEITDSLNELYIPLDVFNDVDYVWMGHIHHPQILNENKPYIAHVGSLDRSDFSKTEIENDKIVILFENNSFKEIKIPTRNLFTISIDVPTDKDSTEFVINNIYLFHKNRSISDAIIKLNVQLHGADLENINREKVLDFFYNNTYVHHVANISETRVFSSVQNEDEIIDRSMNFGDIIDKFIDLRKDQFESDDEKIEFKNFSLECERDFNNKYVSSETD